jgi:hypothetical protein
VLRRDFLKTAAATAVLTATLPDQAMEIPARSNGNFADVNGLHIFYSVHGAGKPLILLHGGIDPDSFGSNLAGGTIGQPFDLLRAVSSLDFGSKSLSCCAGSTQRASLHCDKPKYPRTSHLVARRVLDH